MKLSVLSANHGDTISTVWYLIKYSVIDHALSNIYMSTIACQRCMNRSSLKDIALVDNKIDYMLLQRRQIIKSVENRKDIKIQET